MEQNKIENNQTNATISASVPEQNVTTTGVARSASGENMMAAGGKKKSNGMLYGMILLAILAIGGTSFGVWAMMDGNSQKNNYEEHISALKSQNSELQEKIDSGSSIIDIDVDTSDVDTADYIYIGEWGLKIKIPELLKDKLSYVFTGESIQIINKKGFGIDSAVIGDGEYLEVFRSEAGKVDFENCEVSCTGYFVTINGFDYSGLIIGNDFSGSEFEALKEMTSANAFSAI